MASPVDAGRIGTALTSGTSQTVNLPSGIVAGDLLVMIVRASGATTLAAPAGWSTILAANSTDASDDVTAVFYKWAAGTEGTTVTVTFGTAMKGAACAWRITGAVNPATQVPEASTIALFTTTANTANPGTISPTGGSKDYLFLALASMDGTGSFTAAPTNYSNFLTATSSGSSAATNSKVAGGSRQLTASSEDPGTFTHSAANSGGNALTVAIHPGPVTSTKTGFGKENG